MSVKLNDYATNASCIGLFETITTNQYVAVVKPGKVAFPVLLEFSNMFKPKAMFPAGTDVKTQATMSEFFQKVMKKNSYPIIGYEYGSFDFGELPVGIDWAKEYPLVKFVDRILSKTTKAVNPKKFIKAVSSFYGDTALADVSKGSSLDVSLSYAYKPFKDLVDSNKDCVEGKYVFTPWQERLFAGLKSGNIKFIGLQGPPGTGKTSFLISAAVKMGLPFKQSGGNFTDTDQLEGAYGVVGDGNLDFIPGPLIECYKYGGMYIIDEANYTPSVVNATIQAMTDGSAAFIQKTTKEVIPRHPNFILGFTWNPDAKGSFPFNSALFNRMGVVVTVDKDTPSEIYKKLKHKHNSLEDAFLIKLSEVPNVVEAWAKQLGSTGYCSLRQLDSFIESLDTVETFEEFKLEFEFRVFNPVCSCNSYKPDKIKGILSSDEYNNLVKDLYDEIDLSNLESTDYEWLLSSSDSSSEDSSSKIFSNDEVSGILDSMFNVSTTTSADSRTYVMEKATTSSSDSEEF